MNLMDLSCGLGKSFENVSKKYYLKNDRLRGYKTVRHPANHKHSYYMKICTLPTIYITIHTF